MKQASPLLSLIMFFFHQAKTNPSNNNQTSIVNFGSRKIAICASYATLNATRNAIATLQPQYDNILHQILYHRTIAVTLYHHFSFYFEDTHTTLQM